jgi:sugar-specific transcriptional regulator TrmB
MVEDSYPHRYKALHIENVIDKLYSARLRTLEEQLKKLQEVRNEIAKIFSRLYRSGIWKIESVEIAKALTREMWKEAEKEILLMTEVGGWVLNTPQLTNILEEKQNKPGFGLYVLLTEKQAVEEEKGVEKEKRIEQKKEFENFLERIHARIYHYTTPVALRMNVVDKKKCLLLLTDRTKEGYEQEIIYFSPSPIVAYSFAELFLLKCLYSRENKDKLSKALPGIDPVLSPYLNELSSLEARLLEMLRE